jgi:hypothetical protein
MDAKMYRRLNTWAGHGGQTAELVRSALTRLAQIEAERPSWDDAVKSDYAVARRLCTGDIDGLVDQLPYETSRNPGKLRAQLFVSWAMPWERQRAGLLLDYVTRYRLRRLDRVEELLETGRPPDSADRHLMLYSLGLWEDIRSGDAPGWAASGLDARTGYWISTTPAARIALRFLDSRGSDVLGRVMFETETKRRALALTLALHVWRLEHGGKMPDSLDQLQGTVLDTLPVDPFTGRAFQYLSEGVSVTSPHSSFYARAATIPAPGMPLIWSPGWELQSVDPSDEPTEGRRWRLAWEHPFALTDSEAVPYGRAFPIAEPDATESKDPDLQEEPTP